MLSQLRLSLFYCMYMKGGFKGIIHPKIKCHHLLTLMPFQTCSVEQENIYLRYLNNVQAALGKEMATKADKLDFQY